MRGNNVKIRLLIGVAIVAFAYLKKCSNREMNEYTGRTQTINMTTQDEIALGFQNREAMARQYGGLYPDPGAQARVDMIGEKLVNMSMAKESNYKFEFHCDLVLRIIQKLLQ